MEVLQLIFNYMLKKSFFVFGIFLFSALIFSTAQANHSWGSYHWARTGNLFTLKLGDNLSTAWESYMATASSDWSSSSVLDTTVVAGLSNPKNCRATTGRVEVCNSKYGKNGWLGIAQVWVSGKSYYPRHDQVKRYILQYSKV